MTKPGTTNFFGIEVTDQTNEVFTERLLAMNTDKKPVSIMGLSLYALGRFDDEMYKHAKEFDFVIPDGKGLVMFSKFLKSHLHHHFPVCNLSQVIMEKFNNKTGKKVFLLGGKHEISDRAVKKVSETYPNIEVRGHHGYFDIANDENVYKEITDFEPDLILVGMSTPLKERVIEKLTPISPSIKIACGGYLDILGGKVKRAPVFIQKIGMEWFYRFIQEPKRLLVPTFSGVGYYMFKLFPVMFYYKQILKKDIDILTIINKERGYV